MSSKHTYRQLKAQAAYFLLLDKGMCLMSSCKVTRLCSMTAMCVVAIHAKCDDITSRVSMSSVYMYGAINTGRVSASRADTLLCCCCCCKHHVTRHVPTHSPQTKPAKPMHARSACGLVL